MGILGPPPTQRPGNISNPPTTPFCRITSQEARERREKGLCYYCDEKYSMGHRCERPQLFMVEDSPDVGEENSNANGQGAEVLDALPETFISRYCGTQHPQTLRVWGRLKNKNLMVLIDGGSTHNFIDQATASRVGLYITRNKKLQVVVANQEKIESCQVVLGIQWLETLGPIEMDYKRLTMTFQVGEISHTLHGLKRTAEAANIEALDSKECSRWQGMGFFFQIQISPTETSHSPDAYPEEIRSLLNRYSRVFEAPTGLPPRCLHDHRIPLQSNTGPVSVRPYQYPYYQKTEIERLSPPVPPPVADDSTILPQLETILARREIQKGKYRPRTEILVKWMGTTTEDATWENAWRFSKSYPNFVLEDKAGLSGGDRYVSHSACPRHVAPAAS
ncbi:hypothetical protein F0562_001977 [Nyssa sinensis]|uniref:Chromo domain-containing protein n=1 Tax=Nyssa sinensis TaxID=561372 RepID=A0A5J5C4H5_9ASTE|nr:hypothetical protein F0562_001977 [Nyssa sinensis]